MNMSTSCRRLLVFLVVATKVMQPVCIRRVISMHGILETVGGNQTRSTKSADNARGKVSEMDEQMVHENLAESNKTKGVIVDYVTEKSGSPPPRRPASASFTAAGRSIASGPRPGGNVKGASVKQEGFTMDSLDLLTGKKKAPKVAVRPQVADQRQGCEENSFWSLCRKVAMKKATEGNCNDCITILKRVMGNKNIDAIDAKACNEIDAAYKTRSCEDVGRTFIRAEGLAKNVACRGTIETQTRKRQGRRKVNIMEETPSCHNKKDDLDVWDTNPSDQANPIRIIGLTTENGVGKIDIIRKTKCSASGKSLMQYAIRKFETMGCKTIKLQDDSGISCSAPVSSAVNWGWAKGPTVGNQTKSAATRPGTARDATRPGTARDPVPGAPGPLRVLYGLKSGEKQSWYESFGFTSTQTGYNKAKDVLDMKLFEFRALLACRASYQETCDLALNALPSVGQGDTETTVWDWMTKTYIFEDPERCSRGASVARVFSGVFGSSDWNDCKGLAGKVWQEHGANLQVYGAHWNEQWFQMSLR